MAFVPRILTNETSAGAWAGEEENAMIASAQQSRWGSRVIFHFHSPSDARAVSQGRCTCILELFLRSDTGLASKYKRRWQVSVWLADMCRT